MKAGPIIIALGGAGINLITVGGGVMQCHEVEEGRCVTRYRGEFALVNVDRDKYGVFFTPVEFLDSGATLEVNGDLFSLEEMEARNKHTAAIDFARLCAATRR